MKIKIVNDTDKKICKCENWLEHWKLFGYQLMPKFCSEVNCFNKPEVGTHVQRVEAADNECFIIPLCKKHHEEFLKTLEVRDDVRLVPASPDSTCGNS
ncbi:MAG: hypothetical protein PHV30_08420 [Candidatus Margulisbacteria bacterium]|nr:hypothetical protein [Candidatus Margulisiibacteriota bacterium]